MKVMIVGHGYVGSAVASIFDDEEKVIIDPKFNDNKISDFSEQKFDAVFVLSLIHISEPTRPY